MLFSNIYVCVKLVTYMLCFTNNKNLQCVRLSEFILWQHRSHSVKDYVKILEIKIYNFNIRT